MPLLSQADKGCLSKYRYMILNEINRGSYGVVYRARDNETGEIVAMKREVRGLCESTKREIYMLKSLPGHPSIVEFKQAIRDDVSNWVFVVMEYLEYDLKRYMKVTTEPFTLPRIKHVMQKLLEGVAFLHDNGVMHRDLKPDNILIDLNKRGNCFNKEDRINNLKICDFGMAALFPATSHSPNVGSRWYKAPELLRRSRHYTSAVDMWSVGCIMAELVLKRALFAGKTSEHDQLQRIHEVIGPSYNHVQLKIVSEVAFSGATRLTLNGLDLLERLLQYDPKKRITAKDALNHAFFTHKFCRRNCEI